MQPTENFYGFTFSSYRYNQQSLLKNVDVFEILLIPGFVEVPWKLQLTRKCDFRGMTIPKIKFARIRTQEKWQFPPYYQYNTNDSELIKRSFSELLYGKSKLLYPNPTKENCCRKYYDECFRSMSSKYPIRNKVFYLMSSLLRKWFKRRENEMNRTEQNKFDWWERIPKTSLQQSNGQTEGFLKVGQN